MGVHTELEKTFERYVLQPVRQDPRTTSGLQKGCLQSSGT